MNAYDKMYLDEAMGNLGEAFDYAVNACNICIDEFMDLFVATGYAENFGEGNPSFDVGRSGTELAMDVMQESGKMFKFPKPLITYELSPEYWCGWVVAYFQWKTGRTFKDIHANLPMTEVLKLYPTLHESSVDKFVDTVNEIIARNEKISRLQRKRKQCGYSQRELAKKSGVNIRTLQQYELKAKDINKASVMTVLSLASALGCNAEDITEFNF